MLDAPAAAALKARYPEFASVPDAVVTAVLSDAPLWVDETWAEGDRTPAMLAFAAHTLSLEGEPRRSANIAAGGTGDVLQMGAIKRDKVGDVEVEYHAPSTGSGSSSSSGGGSGDADRFGATPYGLRFLALRRRNFPAVLVV